MKRPHRNGLLVGVEGIDAAGKRTQTLLLVKWLRRRGLSVSTASFPDYSTTIGREIRNFLHNPRYPKEAGHMLYAVNRWEVKDRLESLLSARDVVVVDRYSESNFAYGVANGLPLKWLSNLEEGLPRTDVVLVLDAAPKALYGRRSGKDRYERNLTIQRKARETYRALAPRFGWKVIDASGDIESVHRLMAAAVSRFLPRVAANGGRTRT